MSYFASIVARAMGTTPLLQPRLPSRYEADPRPLAAPLAEMHGEREAAATMPASVPSVPRIDAPATRHAEGAPVIGETRHVVETRETSAPAPPPSRIVQTERVFEHRSERVEELHDHTTVTSPVAAPRFTPPAAPFEAAPAEVREERRETPPPLRALLMPPPPPRTIVAQTTRVTTAAAPAHEESDTAPTIRVTIGRVDVRAVQAPLPAAKPRAARTPFTLDDYARLRKDERK